MRENLASNSVKRLRAITEGSSDQSLKAVVTNEMLPLIFLILNSVILNSILPHKRTMHLYFIGEFTSLNMCCIIIIFKSTDHNQR